MVHKSFSLSFSFLMNSLCNRIDDHHISFAAIDIKEEVSVATLLMNMENEFDPFDALSTPLYQTATFKQVVELNQRLCCHFMVRFLSLLFFLQPSAIENGPYDYTRSGNPTRDALQRYLFF